MSSTFFLGTHLPSWFSKTDVPLFVSRTRLIRQQSWAAARGPWALDSGGFTVLNKPPHRWQLEPARYAEEILRYDEEIGKLEWAAPMDWMCEPSVRAKTGLSVRQHQRLTTENFLALREQLGGAFVIPVLQGWDHIDYLDHVAMYEAYGVDLTLEDVVGVGSVCRRSATDEICEILGDLKSAGLRLHAFGVKGDAWASVQDFVASADSMAWSLHARLNPEKRRPECVHPGKCSNCIAFALHWRDELLSRPHRPHQSPLFKEALCVTAPTS